MNAVESNQIKTDRQPAASPDELSKRLADLFEAKSHQEQILSASMKSKIEVLLKTHPKKTVLKEYRATDVLYCNGEDVLKYTVLIM